jgi:hypothetical protein
MARDMKFGRETVYRAVVLYLYQHKDDHIAQNPDEYPVKQYVLDDGTVIHYNYAKAYGPYSAPGTAKTQAKQSGTTYWYDPQARRNIYGDSKALVARLVEKTEIDWTQHERLA